MQKVPTYKKKKSGATQLNSSKAQTSTHRTSLYTDKWKRYRFRFLHHNKQCYACGSNQSLHVDHIVAHKGNKELFWKLDNYMPLCHKCHSYATKWDAVNPPETTKKLEWINASRKVLNINVVIKVVPFKGENL